MGFSFDALNDKPVEFGAVEEGVYKVVVMASEAKVAQTGRQYLNLRCDIMDDADKKIGSFFDRIMDPEDKPLLQYRMHCFMRAVGATEGEWTIETLAKIAKGKQYKAALKVEKDNKDNDINTVDVFKHPCYDTLETEAPNAGFMPAPAVESDTEEGVPFAADSEY